MILEDMRYALNGPSMHIPIVNYYYDLLFLLILSCYYN